MESIDDGKRYFSTFYNIKDSIDEDIQKLIENILINENGQIVPNYSLEREIIISQKEELELRNILQIIDYFIKQKMDEHASISF